jgi:hypothetical protein
MKDRSRAAVLSGRFRGLHLSAISTTRGRAPVRIFYRTLNAPPVANGIRLIATEKYTKADVLKTITDAGRRTRKGKKLSAQTFERL